MASASVSGLCKNESVEPLLQVVYALFIVIVTK